MGDFISQEEIDALLKASGVQDDVSATDLSVSEIDAIGEIGNISMGTSATTLSQVLGRKVNITTPEVTILSMEELVNRYANNYVVVKVEYTRGIKGNSFMVLREHDCKAITDLMMGGDGTNTEGEITDLHLSAISEAMNQMIGSSATSMSQMLGSTIDISPPKSNILKLEDAESFFCGLKGDKFVKVSFRMIVDDVIDSEIMQLLPIEFSKQLVSQLIGQETLEPPFNDNPIIAPKPPESQPTIMSQPVQQAPAYMESPVMQVQDMSQQMPQFAPPGQMYPQQNMQQMQPGMQPLGMAYDPNMQMYQQPQYVQNPYGMPMQGQMPQGFMQQAPPQGNVKQPVNIQPVNFQTFDESKLYLDKKNVDIIMDVPLQVTVELGRTNKLIREILEFGAGTIIELDKLAGEPVDILVNGKIIAKGEVVVIDESFGVRITEIVQPSMRL